MYTEQEWRDVLARRRHKAKELVGRVERIAPGKYLVPSWTRGELSHTVDLETMTCTCEFFVHRLAGLDNTQIGQQCHHIIAALLYEEEHADDLDMV